MGLIRSAHRVRSGVLTPAAVRGGCALGYAVPAVAAQPPLGTDVERPAPFIAGGCSSSPEQRKGRSVGRFKRLPSGLVQIEWGLPFRQSGRRTRLPAERVERPISILNEAIVLTVGTLFPIMNPFSTAPLFVSLTAGFEEKRRNRDALMACLYAFGILALFLLLGTAIIDFFGISVPGIRIAGGLIISALGFRMLFPVPAQRGSESAASELEIAFTPLAMPSLAGPGSISVVVTAASQIKSNHPENYSVIYAGVIAGIAVTLLIAWIILRTAASMARLLGPSGIDAVTRIFGFLLVSIGIQFLLTGVSDFFGLSPS